jgi:hypothetical protein
MHACTTFFVEFILVERLIGWSKSLHQIIISAVKFIVFFALFFVLVDFQLSVFNARLQAERGNVICCLLE